MNCEEVRMPDVCQLLVESCGLLGPPAQLLSRVLHLGQLQLSVQQLGRDLVHLGRQREQMKEQQYCFISEFSGKTIGRRN